MTTTVGKPSRFLTGVKVHTDPACWRCSDYGVPLDGDEPTCGCARGEALARVLPTPEQTERLLAAVRDAHAADTGEES